MRTATLLAVATLVVLAGCTGGLPAGDATAVPSSTETLHVYVSDDPGAIDQFEHLNVRIAQLSVRAAAARDDHDDGDRHRHRHHGNWTSYDLHATTVDLTELRGANASLLHAVGVPSGEYTAVSVTVDGVNATLESGERADVRVPNDRLTVRTEFTVDGDDSTEFVVDAVVRERGDGYVLVPNVEASGADVEIRSRGCGCCEHENGGHYGSHDHGNDSHHGDGSHHRDHGHGNWSHHNDSHHHGTDSGDGCRHD
jgi:hypothetical protein